LEDFSEWAQQLAKDRMQGIVGPILRDLEIQRRERALSSSKPADVVKGESDDRLPLFRRKVLDQDLVIFSEHASKINRPLGCLMIDFDRFKQVNDSHGHVIGDEVLLDCTKIIDAHIEGKGKCYRYGGEEVTILLPNFSVMESVGVAETLRKAIEKSTVSSKGLNITVSIGVACLPEHASDANSLLSQADKAVYQAKKLGRNLVRVSGEPEKVKTAPRTIERRQPDSENLNDEEQESIRRTYFSHNSATCPRDDVVLKVHEVHRAGFKTPDLVVMCPYCGLQQTIRGIPL